MNLEQKAYKCIVNFDNYFDTPIDESHWNDKEVYQIIYGKGIHSAVKEFCETDDFSTYEELIKGTTAKRFKDADLYSQEPSELLKDLTKQQIHHLTHSLGVDIGDRCPVDFYRNYSLYYEKHEECEYLVIIGLMTNWQKRGAECYAVTEAGKEAVKTLLLVTK